MFNPLNPWRRNSGWWNLFVSPFLSLPLLAFLIPVTTQSESTALGSTRRLGRQASLSPTYYCFTSVSRRQFSEAHFLVTDRQTHLTVVPICDSTDSYWRRVNNLRPTSRVNVPVTSNVIIGGHYAWSGSYKLRTFAKGYLSMILMEKAWWVCWTAYCSELH